MTTSDSWAPPLESLGSSFPNVRGRTPSGPVQGFGRLWEKTYRLRLVGVAVSPEDVIADLKARLPGYLPPASRFAAPDGLRAGGVVGIDSWVSGFPVRTGVLVLYADATAFTLMTPAGHPESGWNTFAASEEDGDTVVRITSLCRATDPLFELGSRVLGGARVQERTWRHVLRCVAHRWGVPARPEVSVALVDPRLNWAAARNVWWNSILRSMPRVAWDLVRGDHARPGVAESRDCAGTTHRR